VTSQPLTAVRVQQLLREVDAELARGKPSADAVLRMLEKLSPAYRPGFYGVSITSDVNGRCVALAQLWYDLSAALEQAEADEHMRAD